MRNSNPPPRRYNQSSLLEKMESEGIGTKATRADIIATLVDKGIHRRRGADGKRPRFRSGQCHEEAHAPA